MDNIIMAGYKGLLKTGIITKEIIYNHVVGGRINTDDYKEIIGEDCPELPLEVLKVNKLKELWIACNQTIEAGFYSLVSGESLLYGFDLAMDQPNLTGQLALLDVTPEPIPWKVKSELKFVYLTREQFTQLCLDGKAHKEFHMQRYFELCGQVQNALDKETVLSIAW
jgi:hypothetical protein